MSRRSKRQKSMPRKKQRPLLPGRSDKQRKGHGSLSHTRRETLIGDDQRIFSIEVGHNDEVMKALTAEYERVTTEVGVAAIRDDNIDGVPSLEHHLRFLPHEAVYFSLDLDPRTGRVLPQNYEISHPHLLPEDMCHPNALKAAGLWGQFYRGNNILQSTQALSESTTPVFIAAYKAESHAAAAYISRAQTYRKVSEIYSDPHLIRFMQENANVPIGKALRALHSQYQYPDFHEQSAYESLAKPDIQAEMMVATIVLRVGMFLDPPADLRISSHYEDVNNVDVVISTTSAQQTEFCAGIDVTVSNKESRIRKKTAMLEHRMERGKMLLDSIGVVQISYDDVHQALEQWGRQNHSNAKTPDFYLSKDTIRAVVEQTFRSIVDPETGTPIYSYGAVMQAMKRAYTRI